jgi:S-adenosylmethionine synthetase
MFEKVNPSHPDKIADRIAGAIVDLAYKIDENPKIAVEVLIGHGICHIIAESSVTIEEGDVCLIVERIAGEEYALDFELVKQDAILAENQARGLRCGDNGIFKGVPVSGEEKTLSKIARAIYNRHPFDGKYIISKGNLVICQSNVNRLELDEWLHNDILPFRYIPFAGEVIVNPLGDWTGGTYVDCGATNRKLGSDMGRAVTGGGLHGKDLSKADVSVNIYAHLMAQQTGEPWEASCAIGDECVSGIPYTDIVKVARNYINFVGGFEKFAEWGLI